MPSVGPSKVGRRTFASNAGVFLRVFSVALGAGIHEHVSRAGERELHGHLSSIQSYFFVPHTQQPSSLASFVFPPSPVTRCPKKKKQAWLRHKQFLGQACNSRAGDCGHHLTYKTQNDVLTRLTKRPRAHRRACEVGLGTGFLGVGLASLGADVFGIELPENSGTIRSIMRDADHVVLHDGDARDLTAEFLDRGRFSTLTCLIGILDITLHVAEIFLRSHYCTELAYLLPSRGAKSVRKLLERGNVALEQIPVTLAGGQGRRSVVVGIKRDILSFA